MYRDPKYALEEPYIYETEKSFYDDIRKDKNLPLRDVVLADEKIKEFQKKISKINRELLHLVPFTITSIDSLSKASYNFLVEKIKEGMSEEEKAKLEKYREELDIMYESNSYYNIERAFDPEFSHIGFIGTEKKEGKIRILVADEEKNIHKTAWFDAKELENLK